MTTNDELNDNRVGDLTRRVEVLEKCYPEILSKLNLLYGESTTVKLLLRYVILPLILLLGALVGIKLILPPAL